MSRACTIYSPTLDPGLVVDVVQKNLANYTIEVMGNKQKWRKITIQSRNWVLTLSSQQREKPGDEFSKLILGTLVFFRGITTDAPTNKQIVIDLVTACNWMIGIVADPDFDEEADHFECIFQIAQSLGGLIFNGVGMIDKEGSLILDQNGNFDKIL